MAGPIARQNRYIRAVALDYDGTLTREYAPSEAVLAAVAQARESGLRVVLVTGRILDELRAVFPAVDKHFDGIVGENGCVLSVDGENRVLAPPIEEELQQAMLDHGIEFRRGEVLVATLVYFEDIIQQEIHRLGLECQIVHNRGELMVLPPGMSKGTGLARLLESMGISWHNTVAVGDAENDHALLSMCHVGVAVGNAVDGLKRHADRVLEQQDGEGVAAILQEILYGDESALRSDRRQIRLGRLTNGDPATIPASRINLLVTGRSKSGKSYVGGMLAEQLVELGYSVCLIDPEGDYASLGTIQGVECLCTTGHRPDLEQIRRFLAHRFGSVVVDMSLIARDEVGHCIETLLSEMANDRLEIGAPHWIIIDEAHHVLTPTGSIVTLLEQELKGVCLVTYQPQQISRQLATEIDYALSLPGGRQHVGPDPLVELGRIFPLPESVIAEHAGRQEALLIRNGELATVQRLRLAKRKTEHIRHFHKYLQGELPSGLRFVFRDRDGRGSTVAANVEQFCELVQQVTADTVAFHAERLDYSRWMDQALQEKELAGKVRTVENQYIASHHTASDLLALSDGVVRAIRNFYA